jgi:hypothetical protein
MFFDFEKLTCTRLRSILYVTMTSWLEGETSSFA